MATKIGKSQIGRVDFFPNRCPNCGGILVLLRTAIGPRHTDYGREYGCTYCSVIYKLEINGGSSILSQSYASFLRPIKPKRLR